MSVERVKQQAVDLLPDGGLEASSRSAVRCGSSSVSTRPHRTSTSASRTCWTGSRDFQRDGHIVVLIVGDYTARIGDPSGRSKERPVLADDVLDANSELFAEQAFRILDPDRTEVRRNGEWLERAQLRGRRPARRGR